MGQANKSYRNTNKMTKFEKTGVIIRERHDISLGALLADTVVKGTPLAMTDGFRMLKSIIYAQIAGLTAAEGEGLKLGLASSDLSVTAIKECLEVDGPLFRGDRDKKEKASRPVWLVASPIFLNGLVEGWLIGDEGGPKITVKPQWTFPKGAPWVWFVYNSGSDLTTGAIVSTTITNFGLWSAQ